MDWLLRYADKFFRTPSREEVERYLGARDACYLGYAAKEQLRNRAASGGIISTLLVYLLEHDTIQGALISEVSTEQGQIQAKPFIARKGEDILRGQSSIYMEFPWLRKARPLIEQAEGNLAVVGLPCTIRALRRLETRDPALVHKIGVHIALVCGRSSSKDLLLNVLKRKGIHEENVAGIRFREGHWRGYMRLWLRDGSEVAFPFSDFSLYRNLHFFCETKCLHCEDPLGESADVVCGDAWLHELRDHPIKHSLVISRTPQATHWLEDMVENGDSVMETIPPEDVFRAQCRGLIPAKRGKLAKARLGRLFGYGTRYDGQWRSRWNDYLVAAMVLCNHRWSKSQKFNPLVFRIPKPALNVYLIAMSLLKNF